MNLTVSADDTERIFWLDPNTAAVALFFIIASIATTPRPEVDLVVDAASPCVPRIYTE